MTDENQADEANRLAVVAVGSIGVILVLSQLPYGRPVTVLVALFAIITSVFSLPGLERRAWLGWGGLVVNVLFLLILIGYPETLGMTCWWPESASRPDTKAGDGNPQGEWIDAGDAAWQMGGVRVALTFATIGTDPSSTATQHNQEKCLWIGLKITNVGVGSGLDFLGWTSSRTEGPILSTPDGTLVATRQYVGPNGKTIIQPARFLECMLAFDIPPQGQDLLLDLPTKPFGDTALIRFRIPQVLVGKQ